MSTHIHCDICEDTIPWSWDAMKGWKKVQDMSAGQAFAQFMPETNVCPECWASLQDRPVKR